MTTLNDYKRETVADVEDVETIEYGLVVIANKVLSENERAARLRLEAWLDQLESEGKIKIKDVPIWDYLPVVEDIFDIFTVDIEGE